MQIWGIWNESYRQWGAIPSFIARVMHKKAENQIWEVGRGVETKVIISILREQEGEPGFWSQIWVELTMWSQANCPPFWVSCTHLKHWISWKASNGHISPWCKGFLPSPQHGWLPYHLPQQPSLAFSTQSRNHGHCHLQEPGRAGLTILLGRRQQFGRLWGEDEPLALPLLPAPASQVG